MNQIYGITGKKGHGKDTLAKAIRSFDSSFKTLHFAYKLKNICKSVFGLSEDDVNNPDKKELLFNQPIKMDDYLNSMSEAAGLELKARNIVAHSPRELMQYIGTDYVRYIKDTYWIDQVIEEIKQSYGKILVTDLRFINEANALKSIGAKIIKIIRPDKEETTGSKHISEIEMDKMEIDLVLKFKTGDFDSINRTAKMFASGQLPVD